jgi:hypothetical protein
VFFNFYETKQVSLETILLTLSGLFYYRIFLILMPGLSLGCMEGGGGGGGPVPKEFFENAINFPTAIENQL